VLHLPLDIKEGTLEGLRRPGAAPPPRSGDAPPGLMPLTPTPSTSAPVVPPLDPPDPPRGAADDLVGEGDPRKLSLLRAIEESLHELPRDAAAPVPAPEELPEPVRPNDGQAGGRTSPADLEHSLARGAPRGSIVPEGGYKSQLPDDDILPP